MLLLKSFKELNEFRNTIKTSDILGFVPTMGALHKGHISLVDIACEESDVVLVSIFVNPTQFNDPADLKRYPRNIDADLKLLSQTCVGAVFIPEIEDIYPEPDQRIFDFGNLTNIMEGSQRPGHFNGVAQVVSRLFDMVKPLKAFFGEKDFQQLAVIKKLVKLMDYNIEIVPCPTIREDDGLAMSSRNTLLNPEQRVKAPLIYKTLLKAREIYKEKSVEELKEWLTDSLNAQALFKVEYFEIVDDHELTAVKSWEWNGMKRGCIAVKIGNIRLIDNIIFD